MDISAIASLPPAALRAHLPAFLRTYIDTDSAMIPRFDAAVGELLSRVDDDALADLLRAFAEVGEGWQPWPAHPLARSLSRRYMGLVVEGSRLEGAEHLPPPEAGPQVWVCNHLSYVDTQVTDTLLAGAGRADVADRLLVVAGPKVYTEPYRRLASLSLNTLKTPQSTQLAHNSAGMSAREVAALALASVRQAAAWRNTRGPVLLYGEGSRSRTGHMGPFLRGASRYLRGAAWVVPVAVIDTDQLFPMSERMRPRPVAFRIGPPVEAAAVREGRDALLVEAWRRVTALLPPQHTPLEDTEPIR